MKNTTRFAAGRGLDVLCLGRFGVDFYAQQIGARLEDVTSFAKYLGGSSANTAFGCARLGLKAGLISRVGDDGMGRFLVETIAREGCDVSHVGIELQSGGMVINGQSGGSGGLISGARYGVSATEVSLF